MKKTGFTDIFEGGTNIYPASDPTGHSNFGIVNLLDIFVK